MAHNDAAVSWVGDMYAGGLTTECWSSTLLADSEHVILEGPNRRFIMAAEKIVEVRQAVGTFLVWSRPIRRGIVIVHTAEDCPPKLVFRARNTQAAQILAVLAALGYPANG